MSTENKTKVTKDLKEKSILISRNFNASLEDVWRAYTESDLLDQWWGPAPWRAETKTMNFNPGGFWLYAMVGPQGEKHWARMNYISIDKHKGYEIEDLFCDEKGNPAPGLPISKGYTKFKSVGNQTQVDFKVIYSTVEDLQKIVEMGFEQGITICMDQLETYLSTQFKLRNEMKPNNMARVTTYLNFPGTTEQAFNFYKKVFNGKFTGNGLMRFGDIHDMPSEYPPMDEATKKLIIHGELTILGGHVLMATDSPESMGFKMELGNNMHINLEPDSREESKRIFDELSVGGKIIMPLTDMFWGAYFGTFTDKFGINWMVNYHEKQSVN